MKQQTLTANDSQNTLKQGSNPENTQVESRGTDTDTDADTDTDTDSKSHPDATPSTETQDSPEPEASAESTTSQTQQAINRDNLPNVFVWDTDPDEYNGATVLHPTKTDYHTLTNDIGVYPQTIAYVVDGKSEYLSQTDSRQIDTPSTYKEVRDEFIPLITGRSCTFSSGRCGIDRDTMEAAIRIATGGGRFTATGLNIYVGDPFAFLIEYKGESFIIRTTDLDAFGLEESPKTAVDSPTYNICGFEIVEDHQKYRETLDYCISEILDYCDITLSSYSKLSGESHIFTLESGCDFHIKSNNLRKITPPFEQPENIIGTHTITPDIGSPEEIDVPDLPSRPGDEHELWGTVIGHRLSYKTPQNYLNRPSKYQRISDGSIFYLKTYYISISEMNTANSTQRKRMRIDSKDTQIAKYTISNGGFRTLPTYRNKINH